MQNKVHVLNATELYSEMVQIWPSNLSYGHLPKKFTNIYLQRVMHPYVHWSIIHRRQDMETTKVSFDRELDKEDAVDIPVCYGILLSHEKR